MTTLGTHGGFADVAKHMVMPVIVLAASIAGRNIRYIRSAMLEILQQDYLRTARAKGIGNFNVINKTGGVSSISLSTSDLPGHSHSIPALSGTTSSAGAHTHKFFYKNGEYTGFSYSNKSGNYINMYLGNVSVSAEHDNIKTKINDGGSHTHNVTMNRGSTGSTGSGTSFTNLPPYITVYMWKRVS